MGFFDNLFGQAGADASREASNDKYGKQVGASKQLEWAGDAYAQNSRDNAQAFNPYVNAGGSALQQLMSGLGLNGAEGSSNFAQGYRGLPGYQAGLETGGRAIDRSAAARSGVQNGTTLKALQRFGSDYEDQRSGNYLQRLAGLAGSGQSATGSQVGTIQQGLTGQLGAQTGAANIMNGAAGTTGDGIIAAQNSQNAGTQNAINLGTTALGMLMGTGGGGGGSSFGSMLSAGASPGDAFKNLMQGGGYYGGSPSSNPNLRPF